MLTPSPVRPPEFQSCGMRTPAADLEALSSLASQATRRPGASKVILEVGTWAGRTALALLDKAPAGTVIFCVDTWNGSLGDATEQLVNRFGSTQIFSAFCRNMGPRLFNTVFPLVGPSKTWAGLFNRKADLIFLDANHDYEAIKADIEGWEKHVGLGGILCGHDYGGFEGVTRAVEDGPAFRKAGYCTWWRQV